MPIYEYRCAQCAHELEMMQKMSDEPLTKCPQCGHNSLNKLISRSSFRLKGAGWYETDFKNKPTQKSDDSPAQSSNSVEPAAAASTDSKETSKAAETPVKTPPVSPAAKPAQKDSSSGEK